jgi:two-component system, chemotaxis family, CheB/CheR fusion protein
MGRLDGARVLLVEDSADVRGAFSLLLEADGAEVIAAATGRDAIDLATQQEFDVLLTDLGLPDVTGDVVIRIVLATARRRPRIVVVTGYDEPFISRAHHAGADVVFTKPIIWTRLLDGLAAMGARPAA